MRKLKIAWITGSNFFNVDEPLMKDLSRCFDITWIVFMSNREKEKDLLTKMFYAVGVKGEVEETKRLLHKYSAITVREADASRILAGLGFNDVPVVLDPTLLLDKPAWTDIARRFSPIKTEPYILVYSVEEKAQNELIGAAMRA